MRSGTRIFAAPALVITSTRAPSGARTPGGGSCQITVPGSAVACDSALSGASESPAAATCSRAAAPGSPSSRGTSWLRERIGAGKITSDAVR